MHWVKHRFLVCVFHDLQLYLGRRCALDIPSQHLTVQLPGRVPVGERYSLLDLYFACATFFFSGCCMAQRRSLSGRSPLCQQTLITKSQCHWENEYIFLESNNHENNELNNTNHIAVSQRVQGGIGVACSSDS